MTGWLLTALISVNAHAAVSLLRQSATITSIDDTANGVVSVALSGNFPNNNLKVGQKIVISGTTNYNGTFTIISVTDQSHFTYEDTSKTNSTAAEATGTAGGHYSSFSTWEDQNRNLTSGAGDTEVLECYNDWESGYGMTSNLTVSGWVTGAANNISITVPPTERHNGTPGSGFRLEFGAGVEIVLDQPNLYITFDGIEIDGNGAGGRFNFPSNANMNPTIKNCIIHDISGSAFFIRVIGTLHAYNNVIYSISGNAFNFYTTGAGYHYIYNNTIYDYDSGGGGNPAIYLRDDVSSTVVAINNIVIAAHASAGAAFEIQTGATGGFDASSNYNLTSDATAPGAQSIEYADSATALTAIAFANIGSDDLRLTSISTARNAGAPGVLGEDILGHARRHDPAWDIGAHEFVSPEDQDVNSGTPKNVRLIRNNGGRTISQIRRQGNTVTVTLSGAWPSNGAGVVNLKAGQSIYISGVTTNPELNGMYTITYVNGTGTQFQYAQYGPDMGSAVSGQGTAGGHYDQLDNWETAEQRNLASDDCVAVAELYNDWPLGLEEPSEILTLKGWTADRTRYVKIYAPLGERHDGRMKDAAGNYTGVALTVDGSNGDAGITIVSAYTRFEGVIVDKKGEGGAMSVYGPDAGGPSYIDSCIIGNLESSGIFIYGTGSIVTNTLVFNSTAGAAFEGGNGSVASFYNCTAVDSMVGFEKIGSGNGTIFVNCLSYNNTTDFVWGGSGTMTVWYSSGNDAGDTADDFGGAGNRVDAVPSFRSYAQDDFRLTASDSAVASYGVQCYSPDGVDINGSQRMTRSGVSIGMDEYEAGGAVPEKVSLIRAKRTINSIARAANQLTVIYTGADFNVGQLVRIFGCSEASFNGVYRIDVSANDVSNTLVLTSYGPDVTNASVTTKGYLGGHYDKLSTWQADFGGTSGNLTAQNRRATAYCYDDWAGGLDDTVTIRGWNTDATRYVTVTAALGDRHNGTPGAGFWMTDTLTRGIVTNYTPYTVIEYLELVSGEYGVYNGGANSVIRNCIIHDTDSGYGVRLTSSGTVYNNIIYDMGTGIRGNSGGIYIYNNTVYGCGGTGIMQGSDAVVWNNIALGNGTDFSSISSNDGYNISGDSTADENGAINGTVGVTAAQIFQSVDPANANFLRLVPGCVAINAGVGTPYTGDVTGGERSDGFRDIGAFESDGTGETIALIRSTRNITQVARSNAGLATVTVDDNTNLKSGQKIVVDCSDNGFDGVYTIHSTSGSTFSYYNPGPTVSTTPASGTAGGHYSTLTACMAARGGIDYAALGVVSGDLVSARRRLTVECYNDFPAGMGHCTSIGYGLTVNASYYLTIYVPPSERHNGRVKDDGGSYTGFTVRQGDWGGLYPIGRHNRVDGVAVDLNGRIGSTGIIVEAMGVCYISNCVVAHGGATTSTGFHLGASGAVVSNCIAYDLVTGFNAGNGYTDIKMINSTAADCTTGFSSSSATGSVTFYNCLASGNTTDFGATNTAVNYNCASSDPTADDFGGSGNRVNQTFAFRDELHYDFHLAYNDTGARGCGVQASFAFEDIDGDLRSADNVWDIGADQYTPVGTVPEKVSLIRAGRTISNIVRNNNTVAVTLSGAYPNNNLKTGQPIVISGVDDPSFNGVYTIASFDAASYDDFTFVQYGPNASSSGGTAGGHYDKLSAWARDFGGTSGSLTSDNRRATAEGYNDWSDGLPESTVIGINRWTVDSGHYVKVTAPPSERHNGVSGNNFKIKVEGTVNSLFYVTVYYTVLEYLDCLVDPAATNDKLINIDYNGDYSRVNGCLLQSPYYSPWNPALISTAGEYTIITNNILLNARSRGVRSTGARCHIANNTIIGYGTTTSDISYGITASGANVFVANNIALENDDASVEGDSFHREDAETFASGSGRNVYTIGSAPGSNDIHYADQAAALTALAFEDAAGLDFSLTANSPAREAGLVTTGYEVDAAGFRRTGAVDIGALEYRASGAVPEKVCLIRQGATISSIQRTNNVVTVTLSGNYPNDNLKAGQKIRISGVTSDPTLNGVYTITNPNTAAANDTFQYVCAGLDNASAITNSGMLAGGHYQTLSAWEQDFGGTSGNLVLENIRMTAECYDDWANGLADSVVINGWTTDATRYITVTAAPTDRHDGQGDRAGHSGFSIDPASGSAIQVVGAGCSYTVVEWLELKDYSYAGVYMTQHASNGIVRNCLMHNGARGFMAMESASNIQVYNNIFYNFNSYAVIDTYFGASCILYNNTIYNCNNGVSLGANSYAFNNISMANSAADFSSATAANCGNNISSDATAPGTGSYQAQDLTTVDFEDPATGNFHIQSTSIAVGHGVQTPYTTDIDGHTRTGSFDIGADEYNASVDEVVKLIRAGAADNILNITRAAGVVTVNLDGAYPNDNLKVGQSIVVKDVPTASFNGTYTIASIASAINQTRFTYNQAGPNESDNSGTGTAGGHYTTLSDWEADFGGIDYAALGASRGNLAAAYKIAVAECYNDWAGGLNDYVVIDGWTTSSNYYVRVYTPVSERHDGRAKDEAGNYTGFTVYYTNSGIEGIIQSNTAYTCIDGIAVDARSVANRAFYNYAGANSRFTNCIAFNAGTGNAGFEGGYGGGALFVNCIAYDCTTTGFNFQASQSAVIYNCTAAGNGTGFKSDAPGTFVFTNCLAYDNTDNFNLAAGTVTYSAANDADIPAGTGNRASQTFRFIDEANNDFRLAYNDTAAKGYGTSLKAEFEATGIANCPDIDGDVRTSWDIGADEAATEFVVNIRAAGQTSPAPDYNLLSTADGIHGNLIDGTMKVFSGTLIGTIPDNTNVTLYRSGISQGVTGNVLHISVGGQALVRYISDPDFAFAANDVWRVNAGNYFTVSDKGRQPIIVFECYNDWPAGLADNAIIYLSSTTDNQHYVVLRASGEQRHTGTPHSGFYLRPTADPGSGYININAPYIKVQGIEVDGNGFAFNAILAGSSAVPGGTEVSGCMLHDMADAGIGVWAWGTHRTIRNKIFNNIIYDVSRGIWIRCVAAGADIGAWVFNNTVYNVETGYSLDFISGSRVDFLAINNIAVDCTDNYEILAGGAFAAGSDYNMTSGADAQMPGAHSISNATAANLFRDITAGSEDLRLKAGAAAIGAGLDLSLYANNPYIKEFRTLHGFAYAKDINSDSRYAGFCIGADEYVALTISGASGGQWTGLDEVEWSYSGFRTEYASSNIAYILYEYSLDSTDGTDGTWQTMTRYDAGNEMYDWDGNACSFVWSADFDTETEGPAWMRLQVRDENYNTSAVTTRSAAVTVDTRAPQGLNDFRVSTITATTATLVWTAATDTNFDHYEIWYGTNLNDVNNRTGTAQEWDADNDAALGTATTATTTITGLTMSNSYYFKIWAQDTRANISALTNHESTLAALSCGSSASLDVTPCDVNPNQSGSYMVNHTGDATVAWTLRSALPADGSIEVTFPAGFDVSGVTVATSGAVNGTLTTVVAGQTVTIVRSGGAQTAAGTAVTITLDNVRNPNVLGTTGAYYVRTRAASGLYLEQAFELAGDDMDGFVFSAPTGASVWGVGDTQTVEWTMDGMNTPLTLEYEFMGAWVPAQDATGTSHVNLTGTSAEWKIPGLPLGATQRLRLRETSANPEGGSVLYNNSANFSISGGMTLIAPNGGENWSVQTQHGIVWTEFGSLPVGVILEYSDDGGSTWNNLAGADDAGVTGINGSWQGTSYPIYNVDGSVTQCYLWRPTDTGIAVGDTDYRVRVRDANTAAPPASDSSAADLTLASIVVHYTPPDRTNTAVRVGATGQNISWSAVGVTNVRLEYYSHASSGYTLITTPSSVTARAVADSPFAWTVPDDVNLNNCNIRAIAVGADGSEGSSGIEGAVNDTLDSEFTVYGLITRTSPVSGAYPVDDSTARVPVAWTGSQSLTAFTFEYCTNLGANVWTAIDPSRIFNSATGSTNGYNWATGSGTAWWQPLLTGSIYYLRVRDAVDTDTFNATTAGELFSVTGLAINDVTPASPFGVGDTVTISGMGAGAANVRLFYAPTLLDAQNRTNCTEIGTAPVVGSNWTRAWTIPDTISDSVFLRVENASNQNIRNAAGPYSIVGVLNVTPPAGPWTVGATETVTGTVTGSVSTVRLEYTTDGGATYTTLNDGDGDAITALSVSGGAFSGTITVPDAISAAFQIRAVDTTSGRDVSLCAASALTAAIQVRGALTIDAPADDFIVNRPEVISWQTTGTIGNVAIYYRHAATSGGLSSASWQVVSVATASGGAGVTALPGSYAWAHVPDVVDNYKDVTESVGSGGIQNNPAVDASDVYMQLRVVDADNSAVYSDTSAFVCRYQYIALRIQDPMGNGLSTVTLEEYVTTTPSKAAWVIADPDRFDGTNTFATGDYRFYPYNGDTANDEAYTIEVTNHDPGGSTYRKTGSFRADADKQVTISVDTEETANIEFTVQTNCNYDSENDAIDITAWITRKGEVVFGIGDPGSSDYDAGATISVNVYDDSGAQLNVGDLGDGITANVVGLFSGATYDPAAGLVPGATYTVKIIVTYNGETYNGTEIFVIPSTFTYEVKCRAVYSSADDSAIINTWLERSGTTIERPGDLTLTIKDGLGATLFSGSLDGYDDASDADCDASLQTNGVYAAIEWDPDSGIAASTVYTVEATLAYQNKNYRTYESFAKSSADTLINDVAALRTDVASVNTNVTAATSAATTAATAATAARTAAEAVQSSVSVLQSGTGDILTAVGAAGDAVSGVGVAMEMLNSTIESVSGTVSAVYSQVDSIDNITDETRNLATQISGIDTAIERINTSSLSGASEQMRELARLYDQLVLMSEEIKSAGAGGLELDDMLEVLEEKKNDYDYLRNKTEELKAAMDLSTQMIDNVANEPVVTMWFEFKE